MKLRKEEMAIKRAEVELERSRKKQNGATNEAASHLI